LEVRSSEGLGKVSLCRHGWPPASPARPVPSQIPTYSTTWCVLVYYMPFKSYGIVAEGWVVPLGQPSQGRPFFDLLLAHSLNNDITQLYHLDSFDIRKCGGK